MKNKFIDFFSYIKEEIEFYFKYNIKYPYINIKIGLSNFWKYKSIIWNDRWYDYSFFNDLVLFKLKDMNEHWCKDTYGENDYKQKEILEKSIKLLEEIKVLEDSNDYEDLNKSALKYKEFAETLYGYNTNTYIINGNKKEYYITHLTEIWD